MIVHRRSRSTAGATQPPSCSTRAARPTACSSATPPSASGALQELRARKLRPGHDVGLICFDDAPWAPFIDPPISVVSQPAYRMGAQAAALLVERIGGAAHPPRRIVLGTDLIVTRELAAPRIDVRAHWGRCDLNPLKICGPCTGHPAADPSTR